MGIYLLRVLDPDKEGGLGWLEKIFGPVERLVYLVARVNPKKQQNWKQYALSLLMLGMVTTVLSYGLFRIQDILPLKANWPAWAYGGSERRRQWRREGAGNHRFPPSGVLCHQYRLAELRARADVYTFLATRGHDAALFLFVGRRHCRGCRVVRGVARQQTRNIGNFWVDLTRITLYLFIPVCLVFALLNVWQGIPMNYRAYTQATTLDQSAAPSATEKPCRRSCKARWPPLRRPRCSA